MEPIKQNKTLRQNHWWYKMIRSTNWFCFRYWWFVWILFIGFLVLFYLFCDCNSQNKDYKILNNRFELINNQIESCCDCATLNSEFRPELIDTIPQEARLNCRVHFSGLIMGGKPVENNISEIYIEDESSEYVGAGYYPHNIEAFPKAVATTFDGIAIDRGTRLIIYESENYQGDILIDITGPAIINNVEWKGDSRYDHCNYDTYPSLLQNTYPQNVRIWSSSNMHKWSYGSCKIICN